MEQEKEFKLGIVGVIIIAICSIIFISAITYSTIIKSVPTTLTKEEINSAKEKEIYGYNAYNIRKDGDCLLFDLTIGKETKKESVGCNPNEWNVYGEVCNKERVTAFLEDNKTEEREIVNCRNIIVRKYTEEEMINKRVEEIIKAKIKQDTKQVEIKNYEIAVSYK